jgi:hypothetical protein
MKKEAMMVSLPLNRNVVPKSNGVLVKASTMSEPEAISKIWYFKFFMNVVRKAKVWVQSERIQSSVLKKYVVENL